MRSLPNEAHQQTANSVASHADASCLWRKYRDTGRWLAGLCSSCPLSDFWGIDLCPDLLSKAARLGYWLIQNHPFIDGNKRIGTHVMLVFLSINGISVEYEDADLIKTVLAVADGTCDEQQFLAWLRQHVSAEKC